MNTRQGLQRFVLRSTVVGLLCFLFGGAAVATIPGFDVVAENEALRLYMHRNTTEIALERKDSGSIWYSNPQGSDRHHVVSIGYYVTGDIRMIMDNYNHAVAFEQYWVQEIDDGVRVEYTFGREWQDSDYIPVFISADRFQTMILDQIEDPRALRTVTNSYTLVELVPPEEDWERTSVFRFEQEDVFGDYYLIDVNEGYRPATQRRLIEQVIDHLVANRDDLDGRDDIQAEDMEHLIGNPTYVLGARVRPWDLTAMGEMFEQIGYLPDDVIIDHEANQVDPPIRNLRIFSIAIEYRLDGDNLLVTLPMEDVSFPKGVTDRRGNEITIPLTEINVLEFFHAGSPADEGFMFVPDGSGALIYFNNAKTFADRYRQSIYGTDLTLSLEGRLRTRQVHLPVYGVHKEGHTLLAIVEDGAAVGRITADIARTASSFNRAFASFLVLPYSEIGVDMGWTIQWDYRMSQRRTMNIYQERLVNSDLQIRFAFLEGDTADYVGMAHYYRQYLIDQYELEQLPSDNQLPLYIELLGAVYKERPVFGAPRQVIEPVTTFVQSKSIVDDLLSRGMDNLHVRYSGWLAGGLRHYYPAAATPERSLGGERGFSDFVQHLMDRGVHLYPDVNLINVYQEKWFDGFSRRADGARRMDRTVARVNFRDYGWATLLSVRALEPLVDQFLNRYSRFEVRSLSLKAMGTQVNADFNIRPDALTDRVETVQIMEAQVRRLAEEEQMRLMIEGGNAYLLPYVDTILSMPLDSSGFRITDQEVPFFQIAVRGFVNYAGEAVNFADNYQKNILKTVETGANLYYRWFYADGSVVNTTQFNNLYAAHYGSWIDHAVALYNKLNQAMAPVHNQPIADHRILEPGVVQTVFANDWSVIVNYNTEAVQVNDLRIGPEDFLVVPNTAH